MSDFAASGVYIGKPIVDLHNQEVFINYGETGCAIFQYESFTFTSDCGNEIAINPGDFWCGEYYPKAHGLINQRYGIHTQT